MVLRSLCLALVVSLVPVSSAVAQNWSFDARTIALGNVSGGDNLASRMVDDQRSYKSIVIPLGLLQVLSNLDVFKPESDEFDIVRTIEYAASPINLQFGRQNNESITGRNLFTDFRNATVSLDLADYRGYKLVNQPIAEGLASPSWGATIRVRGERGGPFQGVYVGAGPYLAMRTAADLDPRVVDILGSEDPIRFPNTSYPIATALQGQFAMAITGGYRGRFAINSDGPRDGVYVAADYNYIHGFRYENADLALRLDTNAAGLLTINPALPTPLQIVRTSAGTGKGFAIDTGVAVVYRGVELGFGVNGIANRINWTDVEQSTFLLGNLFLGGDFVENGPFPADDLRVSLPKDYHVNAGYHADRYSVMGEYAHGFQGDTLRGGLEYRPGGIELRGGGVYSRDQWNPTGGVGLNITPRFAVDVALYTTTANAARERHGALALSLRITPGPGAEDNRVEP